MRSLVSEWRDGHALHQNAKDCDDQDSDDGDAEEAKPWGGEPQGDGWWQPIDRLDKAGLPTIYRRAAELVISAREAA